MDSIQQEINMHKFKLFNLVNNLNNTQLIDDEISINNVIKTESECIKSLLNIKQTNLMNQINQNNNINADPFVFQSNLFMNSPIMNINPMRQNNFNLPSINNSDNTEKINVKFSHGYGFEKLIICEPNKKIYDLIQEYRIKANDFGENVFFFNGKWIDPLSSNEISKIGIKNGSNIIVSSQGDLIASLKNKLNII